MPADLSVFKNGHAKAIFEKDDDFDEKSVENDSLRDETESNAQFLATDDLIRDLIEAVKEEEVLYKPTHKHFRHLIKKHEAYVKVAEILKNQGYDDVTAERVKQKWNTIKSVYWRHRNHCGNPCPEGTTGFVFCRDLQFLSEFEFRFYRNRKAPGEKMAEKLQKAGNATALVSRTNELPDDNGMSKFLDLINSMGPVEFDAQQVQNDTSENSNHSDAQSVQDYRHEPTASEILLNNTLKRPSSSTSYQDEVQTKKLLLLDLELEHQKLVNVRAEQQARSARLEAELLELRVKQERAKLKQLGAL